MKTKFSPLPGPPKPEFRPYFVPDMDVDTLPADWQAAIADIVTPLYRMYVLRAVDPLDRSLGMSVVNLTWQELLEQFDLRGKFSAGLTPTLPQEELRQHWSAQVKRATAKLKICQLIHARQRYRCKFHGCFAGLTDISSGAFGRAGDATGFAVDPAAQTQPDPPDVSAESSAPAEELLANSPDEQTFSGPPAADELPTITVRFPATSTAAGDGTSADEASGPVLGAQDGDSKAAYPMPKYTKQE